MKGIDIMKSIIIISLAVYVFVGFTLHLCFLAYAKQKKDDYYKVFNDGKERKSRPTIIVWLLTFWLAPIFLVPFIRWIIFGGLIQGINKEFSPEANLERVISQFKK